MTSVRKRILAMTTLLAAATGSSSLTACAPAGDDAGSATQHETTSEIPPYTFAMSPAVAAAGTVDEAFVRREVEAAVTLYRAQVAATAEPVTVVVDPPDCLRTGYDMPTRKVSFCNNSDTPRMGTASADVIHHEVFHALLCQTKPAWCDSPSDDETALHEGLADFFAYQLAPDDFFGEGFYSSKPYIRRYREPYCYSLVSGAHERGNAIVAALIAGGEGLAAVKRLTNGEALSLAALFNPGPDNPGPGDAPADACFGADAPEVERTVVGYPESTLERYRIRAGAPLSLSFAGNDAFARRYPNLTIRWEPAPALFDVKTTDSRSFEISAKGANGYNKASALFIVDDQVVGGKAFYFQIANAPTP